MIDEYEILPVKVDIITRKKDQSLLEMTLFEGRNRQIRKMCEMADVKIKRLCRIAIGELVIGDLALGKWRFLTSDEVDMLRTEK